MHDEHGSALESEGVPDALRNWQVLEIDGQATPVAEPPHMAAPQNSGGEPSGCPEELRDLQIEDRSDDVIVATLDNRRRQVECGGAATYAVSILNNGEQPALFQVHLEGWLDPLWLDSGSPGGATTAVLVEPGGCATLRLPLSPPRRAESEAGDYHFAVCVRSPQHPGRVARIGAVLTVLPFDAVELRLGDAHEPVLSWLKRTAVLPLVVTNRGNQPAEVELTGFSPDATCRIAFSAPSNEAGSASVSLQPNQERKVPVRVQLQRPPPAGLHGREFDVVATARVRGQAAAAARTTLLAQPLLGPWHFLFAGGLAAAGALGLLLFLALVYFLAQRSTLAPAAAAQPVSQPAAQFAAPPVIIVNLEQPAAAPVQGSPAANGQPGAGGQGAIVSNFTAGASPDPSLPLVLPDQVSAPDGAVSPAAVVRSQPAGGAPGAALTFDAEASAAAPAESGGANQTYGQMFQEIGRRYDLDWRMLAAQAYIESGFDSLALSDAGAMGLMQVLPNTWREWAAPVEVSDPFDAYSNVLVAAVYLDHLRSQLAARGYPNVEWMLVAYNWGPDKVNDFLASGGTWDTLPQARRQYATEILRIAKTIP